MSDSCIFCKIARSEIPADKIFEDNEFLAFKDIRPAAPTHFLIIPKTHIPTLNDTTPGDTLLLGKMLATARNLAKKAGIAESGYRTIINCNRGAGQMVFHLHMHVLGGKPMGQMG